MTKRTAPTSSFKLCGILLTLLLLSGVGASLISCGGGEKAEVQQSLDDFTKALNDDNPAAVADYFDWSAIASQFEAENPEDARFLSAGTSDLAEYMKNVFISQGAKEMAGNVAYTSDVKHIDIENGTATVTFKGGEVVSMKKEGGKWRFDDLSSLGQ